MANQLLPTDAELAQLTSLVEIRQWVGAADNAWQVLSQCLGTVPSSRILATVPLDTFQEAVCRSRISLPTGGPAPDREFTAVEIIQAALMWRVARRCYSLPDEDPLVAEAATAGQAAPAAAATTGGGAEIPPKNTAIDQLDHSEIELADQAAIQVTLRTGATEKQLVQILYKRLIPRLNRSRP